MTLGELWPNMRLLSRLLAVPGWLLACLGMVAALFVAITSGLKVSSTLQVIQVIGSLASASSIVFLACAVFSQPLDKPRSARWQLSLSNELPIMVRSFYFGALMMLLGAVLFTLIGLFLSGGPTSQTLAFSQVFLTGACSSALSYLLFSRACSLDEPER
ncbi:MULTISPECIES: hypothetical protein [Arthrobacter]|uniref:Transmembrane protein n=2 Tax=Arthrobacter TaxID=1663 RepID=A0ABU9KMZ0_9MICC|nr:hypothetical protein [Arthrobacter sp. YJM1]MDP5227929.1 hypothetical protein [Arthrobacter sp. YJM1]